MKNPNQNTIYILLSAIVLILAVLLASKLITAPIPKTLALQIPYTTQAPDGNWFGNENCEEASATMANAFLNGDREDQLPADAALQQINNLLNWENQNLGHNANTGVDETSKMLQGALSLKTKIINNFTANDIKQELASGHVVLMPLNIPGLNNPAYQTDPRTYHMIVIRGYNDQGFIVNDPGMTGGENNIYSFDVLHNAGADWNQSAQKVDLTKKSFIAVWK